MTSALGHYNFLRQKKFGREIFNSVNFFPDLAHDVQSSNLQSRWCLVYYMCDVSPRLGSRRLLI